jgi:hypothetical protein
MLDQELAGRLEVAIPVLVLDKDSELGLDEDSVEPGRELELWPARGPEVPSTVTDVRCGDGRMPRRSLGRLEFVIPELDQDMTEEGAEALMA